MIAATPSIPVTTIIEMGVPSTGGDNRDDDATVVCVVVIDATVILGVVGFMPEDILSEDIVTTAVVADDVDTADMFVPFCW